MALVDRSLERRPTDNILENLRGTEAPSQSQLEVWYKAGADFCFYAPAQEACKKSLDRLAKLKLEDEELALLKDPPSVGDVVTKLERIAAEQEKRRGRSIIVQKSSKFFNTFCSFADKTSHIVMLLLPQSPEYTVTFGMLFLLFQTVVTKKEREDTFMEYFNDLVPQLPLLEFYSSMFPTSQMKDAVVQVYIAIMKLLDDALVYFRGGKLSKLVDAICHPESKLDEHIKHIERGIRRLNALKEAGHMAQSADMMKVVSDTGKVVAKLYENLECQANAIGTSMEMMNAKIDAVAARTNLFIRFEMLKNARELRNLLLVDSLNVEEDRNTSLNRQYRLSPKDHWENNGVLHHLRRWSETGRDVLLWIGGTSGNQDSWVSELSVDMIRALQTQTLTLVYVFCEQRSNAALTPVILVRKLLAQLLELHPEIPYEYPETFDPQRVRNATSFFLLWEIFVSFTSRVKNLFVVIDRVEECEAPQPADITHQLLPTLVKWAAGNTNVSVVLTSTCNPPDEILDLPMFALYTETTNRAIKRNR
ncbi:MAG: hypothetical protein M1820_005993 [Bogoriella megaspora]|nr:MAG: hypothetical protein M1820_005993 [Bogoriella megaspora]